ncbi:hypothetical protein SOCE26_071310 [Sorangium cellulosum]|uniref:Secreted protein n=1 Tax=Sorangium cellulosum TaxID=56 RepID=A0A2L0F261_SORCE|nr:hypothetical protein [Sorangium cellulosum]AUX45636.1 hypothetical protein SOCE26_071310 [Sorangium cellulosum]
MASFPVPGTPRRGPTRAARPAPSAAILAAAALAALAAGALVAGCGADDATGGRRLTLATQIAPDAASVAPFTNALGWTVTLSKAYLSVGPLYYFEGAPFTARRGDPGRGVAPALLERLARWALPEAHAHPGHYQAGEARGQMTEPTSVDLLRGTTALADADAVSGVVRSARFTFGAPPVGPLAGALDGRVVVVEGRAEKGDLTRAFRARAAIEDVLNASGEPAVEGCVFEEVVVDEPGVVTLVVKPAVWLDQVDFEGATDGEDGEDGAPVDLPPGSQALRGFTRGLKKGTAYTFAFAPRSPEEEKP